MDPKPKQNRREYIAAVRRMTPEQQLLMALEMGETGTQGDARRDSPRVSRAG